MAWDPRQGAPSWYASGSGTAKTPEEFEKQRQWFRDYNVASGQTDAATGGNTQTITATQRSRPTVDVDPFSLKTATPPSPQAAPAMATTNYFSGGIVAPAPKKQKPADKYGFAQQVAQAGAYAGPTMAPKPGAPGAQPTAQPTPTAPVSQPTPVAPPVATPASPPTPPVVTPPTRPSEPPAPPAQPRPSQPAAPQSNNMADELWRRALQNMDNPSRYDADVVKQGAKVIEDTIARMRTQGIRNLGEHHASRGLIGSSLESNDVVNLNSELDAHAREQLSNLQREQAMTFGADRNSAFGLGLGAGGLSEQIADRMGNEYFRGQEFDQRQSMFDQDLGFRRDQFDSNRYFQGRDADRADKSTDANISYNQESMKLQQRGASRQDLMMFADLVQNYPNMNITADDFLMYKATGQLPPQTGTQTPRR